ncbi:MAG: hypothetical protein ABFD81_07080 [Syntrophaceae bacterium]
MSYQPKVFRKDGGDTQEVDYGGKLAFGVSEVEAIQVAPESTGVLTFSESVSGAAPFVQVGKFVSAAVGSGMVLNSTKTKAFAVYTDDGGTALSGTDIRVGLGRLLITKAITDTDLTLSGWVGQIKVGAVDISANTSYIAGVRGYIEVVAGGTIYNATGLRGCVELPATAVIASGGILSGVMIDAITLAGTHTGKASMVHIPNPGAGTWDYFLDFGSAPGAIVADTSNLPAAATYKIKCRIGSTDFYLIGVADF